MSLSFSQIKQISSRYATALYDLASTDGKEDQVAADMRAIKGWMQNSADLAAMTANPTIAPEEKMAVFAELLSKTGAASTTTQFIQTVAKNNRTPWLGAIADAYEQQFDRANGIARITIISATPLSDAQRSAIATSLADKKQCRVELSNHTDPSLIGGLIIRDGSQMLDASVVGRLKRLEQQMNDGQTA